MPLPIWPEPITPTFFIMTAISYRSDTLFSELAERVGHLRNRLIQIRAQAVIGNLEDRRILVLVDRHDDLGILHAGEMLDRAGNADGDIKLGRYHLAGLADLPVVRRVASIHRGARGANRGADLVGERLDIFGEILAALHGAATGHDDLGRGQFGPVVLGDFLADKAGKTGIAGGRRILHRRTAPIARGS